MAWMNNHIENFGVYLLIHGITSTGVKLNRPLIHGMIDITIHRFKWFR